MRTTIARAVPRAGMAVAVALFCLVPAAAIGDETDPARGSEKCHSWLVQYDLENGSELVISDTPMGAGDGAHPMRSGAAKVRFANAHGQPASGTAQLLDLRMATETNIEAGMFGLKAKVKTRTTASFTPDAHGVVARGRLDGGVLKWDGPARGYQATSTVHCEGALCGRFGAPPKGESQLKQGPYPVQLESLRFSEGVKRFGMARTQVNRTETPKQTTSWVLHARETKRSCVAD